MERLPSGRLRTAKQLNDVVQRLWEEKRAALEAGAGVRKGGDHTIGAVLDEWIRLSRAARSARTITGYALLRKHYLAAVSDHRLRDFGLLQVDRFIAWLQERGLEPVTVNIRLRSLNTFLNWALERELIAKKPRIRQLRAMKKLPKVLSEQEVEALFSRLAERRASHPNRRQRRFYALHERFLMVARYTGARRSEVFWLRWEQIDLAQERIRIEKQTRFTVKELREKGLPIPDVLADYLARERAEHPEETYLLDDGRGNLAYANPNAFTQVFNRHLQRLGFAGRGIKPVHGFRAYFAGELRNTLGLDLHTIKTWLGHSNVSVTEGYFPDPDGLLREGVRQYDRMMKKHRRSPA